MAEADVPHPAIVQGQWLTQPLHLLHVPDLNAELPIAYGEPASIRRESQAHYRAKSVCNPLQERSASRLEDVHVSILVPRTHGYRHPRPGCKLLTIRAEN